jgi:hypothetical protein
LGIRGGDDRVADLRPVETVAEHQIVVVSEVRRSEPDAEQFTEPEREISGSGERFGELDQITEPVRKQWKRRVSEITEPPPQITEPADFEFTEPDAELGREINADVALSADRRLWNLETYEDRHGKRRIRRSLRFVTKPCRIELGKVTADFDRQLGERPGRGRWRSSRAESELFRQLAHDVAKSVERDKKRRRKRKAVSKKRRGGNTPNRGRFLPAPSDHSQWDDVPDMLM